MLSRYIDMDLDASTHSIVADACPASERIV